MQEDHWSLEFEYRLGNMVRAYLEEGREGRKVSVCLSRMSAVLFCTQRLDGSRGLSVLLLILSVY